MAQQRVTIIYPDGRTQRLFFPTDHVVKTRSDEEWLAIDVTHAGFAVYNARIWHGNVTNELVEDEPDGE